jgi:translation initiation factor IF-3
VLDAEGKQLGIMTSRKALSLAEAQGLDLVLIAESAQPPVCKIADYGKLKYMEAKRKRENHKRVQETKSLQISPRISDHDLSITQRKAGQFLAHGDKVRLICQFRNRELAHPEQGRDRLNRLATQLDELGVVESPPTLEGRMMIMILRPRTDKCTNAQR